MLGNLPERECRAAKKLCLLFRQDHTRHVIIQRQIATFTAAGFDVVAIDQGSNDFEPAPAGYEHIRLADLELRSLIKPMWAVIRRIGSRRLNHLFWSAVLRVRFASNAALLASAAVRQRPDCYVAEDLLSAWAAVFAGRLLTRPVVYSAHEIESEQGDGEAVRIQKPFLRSLERRVIPRVDHLVVPNRARAEWYQEEYGTRRDPVVVRNCPPVHHPRDSDKLRTVLGLDSSQRIVLYHGALIPHRALDQLTRSAAFYDDHIVLVFLGDQGDYYHDALLPLTQDEGLRDRVMFLPYVQHDEVLSYVASADLGVVIYHNVNLNNYLCAPTKLYEYIMMDVPVAACAFPGLTDFMEHYPIGWTFDPADPLSIARAVNHHFAAEAEATSSIKRALARARRDFSWETESQRWLALLNGTLG